MINKRLLIIIVIIAIPMILIIIYALIPRATITFSIAPTQANVAINGKKQSIKNQQSITVAPGEVTVVISRSEFDTYTEKLTIKNGEKKDVVAVLTAQTPAAQKLLETPEAQLVVQRFTSKLITNDTNKAKASYPILKDLPINDKFYTITPCDSQKYADDKTKVAVCISLTDNAARQSALDAITKKGYRLDDYEIIITDNTYNIDNDETIEQD